MNLVKHIASMLLGVALAVLPLSAPAEAPQEKQFGKTLVIEHEIPQEIIAKYAAFKPSQPEKGESALVASMLADTVDWRGPEFKASASSNPYTLALKITGRAKGDGNVAMLWQAGWTDEEGVTRSGALPGPGKLDAKAGEQLTLAAAAGPITFTQDRTLYPSLGFVRSSNFEFESARLQVWSGVANPTAVESFLSFPAVLVGLAFFAVVWWFKRG